MKHLDSRGFSLTEIMVLIGVVAILATAGGPVLLDFIRTPREGEEIESLRLALNQIRNRTILSDSCSTVTVDSSSDTIITRVYSTCGPPLDNLVSENKLTFKRLHLNSFNTGGILQFKPGGGTTESGPAEMNFEALDSKKHYTVTILPAIGNVRIRAK